MITIDSRRCGAGKTHGKNGTINRIKYNRAANENSLIVLPSIKLVDKYAENFSRSFKITSDVTVNVQAELQKAITEMYDVVIITHAAFLQSEITPSLKRNYHLIIDEAFDPWRFHDYTQEKKDQIFDWNKLVYSNISWQEPEYSTVMFDDMLTNSVTRKSTFIRDISSRNWVNFINTESLNKMLDERQFKINIIQELDPMLLSDWESVHVACAMFEKTFMHMWFKKHKIRFTITEAFEKHKETLNVYYPDSGTYEGGWDWSRNKKTTMAWLHTEFKDHFSKTIGDTKYLRLKNNIDVRHNEWETSCPHNAAGSNDYKEIESVVLESALNPSPEMGKWLQDIADTYLNQDQDKGVYAARTGYTYYQVLMRCCLRKNLPADVYVIDRRAVSQLCDYFDNVNLCDWIPTTPKTYIPKQQPLTSAERVKAKRLRDKYPEKYAGLKSREILDSIKK
jgi:hypothetical protein